jgi:hypothetical protein
MELLRAEEPSECDDVEVVTTAASYTLLNLRLGNDT